MGDSKWQREYAADAAALGEIGRVWSEANLGTVEVRLPRSLAEAALAAWERDGDEGPAVAETYEERVHRHRAGTLALIGLTASESGRWEGDEMIVRLSPDLIGVAVDAADERESTLPGSYAEAWSDWLTDGDAEAWQATRPADASGEPTI